MIERPLASTPAEADRIRYAGDLTNTSGLLAHTGDNYTPPFDVGTETVRLWYYGIRPDLEIIDAFNRALEFVFFSTYVGISHLSDLDGDMAVSTDADWTDVGTPTISAKSVEARRTPYGLRSLNTVGDAANEGTRSATIGVTQSAPLRAFTIASANSGTASFQPYDITNSAVIGTAITTAEEEPQLLSWTGNAPATCKEVANYHIGTTNPSDIFWNMSWLYKLDNLSLNIPSYLTEAFQVPTIFQGRPRYSSGTTGVYPAGGLEFVELTSGFKVQSHHADANAYRVIFEDSSVFEWPLFVQARRPYSDLGTLSAETDTTTAPLHLLLPRIKLEVLSSVLLPREPGNPKWLNLLAQSMAEWSAANAVRPVTSTAHRPAFQVRKA